MLKTIGLTKRFGTTFCLHNLNIELRSGETRVLIGDNGAGKTTLVKLLAGTTTPDEGKILVFGKEVRIRDQGHARSIGIAVSHQNSSLFLNLSVAENLLFFQNPKPRPSWNNRGMYKRARTILDEFGLLLGVDPEEKVRTLSAGQQKQLQLASTLSQDCPIIILDDPASFINIEDQLRIGNILLDLKREGKAILYSCNRIDEARRFADVVTILRRGKVVSSIEKKEQVTSTNLLMGMIGVMFSLRANPELTIEHVSPNVEAELGYKPDSLVSEQRSYTDIIHPEDRLRADDLLDGFQRQGVDEFEREYRLVCADGRNKWFHELAHAIRDSNGAVQQYDVSILDITEARTAQEALRQSEKRYEDLVGDIPDIVYTSTPDGIGARTFISRRWEDWTGYSAHELYREEKAWAKAVHAEDVAHVLKAYSDAALKKDSYCIEYRLLHRYTGQVRYVRDRGRPTKDDSGRVVRFDGIISDITSLKELEIKLLEHEQFLSQLIDNAPMPILVYNRDTSVRYVNHAMEELTGYKATEILGHGHPYPWNLGEEDEKTHLRIPVRREHLCQKKDGSRLWLEMVSTYVDEGKQDEYRIEIWRDITLAKEFTETLRSYANLVTSAQENERKRLARELHDDTIQSMFSLCTDIGSFMRRNKQLSTRSHQELGTMIDRVDSMIKSVRTFCQRIRPDIIDHLGLIPAVRLLVQEVANHEGMACTLETDGMLRRLSPDIELSLFRIVQEALNNAVRHAQASQLCVRLTINDGLIRISISDNGRGFKVPDTARMSLIGKLGLVGMRERANSIGGTLRIESDEWKGTEVTVEAPISNDVPG
jgi:two-component system sensor histidine kinase DegS